MKSLLHLLPMALLCAHLNAQNTADWFVSGARWKYTYESLSGPGEEVIQYAGTATKGGQTCAKLHVFGIHQGSPYGPFDHGYEYLFARNDSVFWWRNNAFQLLYDFTRKSGDVFAPANTWYDLAVVDNTGTDSLANGMTVRFQDLRMLHFSTTSPDTFTRKVRLRERLGGPHLLYWGDDSPLSEIQYFPACYADDTFPGNGCGLSYDPSYVPFPKMLTNETATWSEESSFWCTANGYQYKLAGDSVIWGVGQGKKVYCRPTYYIQSPCPTGWAQMSNEPFQVVGLLDQSIPAKKVYFTRLTTNNTLLPACLNPFGDDPLPLEKTVLLYDFDLNVGDTVSWRPEPSNVVVGIDSIELNDGSWRRRFLFDNHQYYYWIEGIGSNFGLLNSRANPFIADISCRLNCFRYNNSLLYNTLNAQFCDSTSVSLKEPPTELPFFLTPNPTGGPITIEVPIETKAPAVLRLYNVEGRLLHETALTSRVFPINLSNWIASGTVIVQVQAADGRTGRKLVVVL